MLIFVSCMGCDIFCKEFQSWMLYFCKAKQNTSDWNGIVIKGHDINIASKLITVSPRHRLYIHDINPLLGMLGELLKLYLSIDFYQFYRNKQNIRLLNGWCYVTRLCLQGFLVWNKSEMYDLSKIPTWCEK